MTNINVAPVHVLIDYAYEVLAAGDPTWNKSNYGGLIPIVPLNEEPELADFDGPKAIYEYTMSQRGTMYYRGQGTVTFAVRDYNFHRMGRALNILDNSLGREDESARDVNKFVQWLKTQRNIDFDVSFGHIRLNFIESGTGEVEENGPLTGVFSISFDYYLEYPDVTYPWSSV
jgi:hypothetical protein